MLLNRQELDKINFPGCSATQCRFVIVFYDAFCLRTVETNPFTARFAPTPFVCFYLKRLVSTRRTCNRLYTDNTNFGGASLKSIRSSYSSRKLFSPFLAENEWEIQVASLSHI